MDSHESERCQFPLSGGHRLPHKVASGFVCKSDIVPLSLGGNDIGCVHKKNPGSSFDCNSRDFPFGFALGTKLLIFYENKVPTPSDAGNRIPLLSSCWRDRVVADTLWNKHFGCSRLLILNCVCGHGNPSGLAS